MSERFARLVVRGRWLVVVGWAALTLFSVLVLPTPDGGSGGLRGLLTADTPAVETEKRSAEIFGFPLIARTVVVQRDPDGLSPYAQARTVVRAIAVNRGRAEEAGPVLGALPITNTGGLFPGARESDTTSLTYLLFDPETSLWRRTRAGERYAETYFDRARDRVVGVTGSVPARTEQGAIIRDALPMVETFTVLAIVLIVGLAFRSVVAPLLAMGTAGVAYVITLRFSGYLAERFDLASPDELEPVVVALLLGVVTDYVIFFCSAARDHPPQQPPEGSDDEGRRASEAATVAAVRRSGPIVAVAGLAVTAGTATLLAAESPFFRALGPALAFTVLVALVVAITLVPAVLAILGDRVFWPSRRVAWGRLPAVRSPRWPQAVVDRISGSRSVAVLVLATTLGGLALAASLTTRMELGVSFVGALPADDQIRATAAQAQEGFADGILSPTVVLLEGEGIGERRRVLRQIGSGIASLPGVAGVLGPGNQPRAVERQILVSRDDAAARFLVVLDTDPLGSTAVETVRRIEHEVPTLLAIFGPGDTTVSLAGDSATAVYVVDQTRDDLVRIAVAALVANLLMLLLFLRALVTSVCLLAATLLGLGATLGITSAVFEQLAPDQGLTFYVPFAAAVLLLAFGSDYNIFSVGHVWESAEGRTLTGAIRHALPSAVSAVFTAGVALGASFGLLSVVPLAPLRQLAFAVGLGLLIEIAVVRLLVLPAMLTVLGRGVSWPSRRFGDVGRPLGPPGRR